MKLKLPGSRLENSPTWINDDIEPFDHAHINPETGNSYYPHLEQVVWEGRSLPPEIHPRHGSILKNRIAEERRLKALVKGISLLNGDPLNSNNRLERFANELLEFQSAFAEEEPAKFEQAYKDYFCIGEQ